MPAPNRSVDEHGFPIPVTFDEPATRKPWSPQQRRWLRAVLAVAVIVTIASVLIGPEIKQGCYESLAEWHTQQAQEAFLGGDAATAADEITDAIYWLPNSARLYSLRARYHEECQKLDPALADMNKVLEINPKYYPAFIERSVLYCRLGKFPESLADADAAVNCSSPGNSVPLNHRAYMRALAGQQLNEALEDVERAIKINREPEPAYLDTRGYLHYLLGDNDAALADLNQAIQITQQQRARPEQLLERRRRADGQRLAWEGRQIALLVEKLSEDLAVMYHHRAEVNKKMGQDDAAATDFSQADKLGYDPAKGVF